VALRARVAIVRHAERTVTGRAEGTTPRVVYLKSVPGLLAEALRSWGSRRGQILRASGQTTGIRPAEQPQAREARATDLSDELTAADEAALAAIAALQAAAEHSLARAQRALDAACVPRPLASAEEAWLWESRECEAWACLQPRLDCADEEAHVVEATRALTAEALAQDDAAAIAALRSELTRYLAGRGLDAATAPVLEALAETLERARRELECGWERIQIAFVQACYAVECGEATVALPGWDDGVVERVELPPLDGFTPTC
jgi:hypothetical protein